MTTSSLWLYEATLLLAIVSPVSQPYSHLPSVVTELRKVEGEYREDKISKSKPENGSQD